MDGSSGDANTGDDEGAENTAAHAGGVLFDAQDVRYNDEPWPLEHQQFVHVSSD